MRDKSVAALASTLLDGLHRHAKTVDVDGQRYYVVESDLLLDENELEPYATQRAIDLTEGQEPAQAEQPGYSALIPMQRNGQPVRWAERMVLTYCVLRDTFDSPQHYQAIVTNMAQATSDWEGICGVKFHHRQEFDGHQGINNPNPLEVIFTVRGHDLPGNRLATAFFPNTPEGQRWILIDPSYFGDPGFDPVGILRHELGHVLGFRHEHIHPDAPPGCEDEDPIYEGTVAFSPDPYDPKSVMHYFCGGRGSRTLEFTDSDREGAQRVYGPPHG